MTHAFESLDGVQEFLLTRILPAVDPSLASEVRAAAKILTNVSIELRTLRPHLEAEFDELGQLCAQAATMLPPDSAASPAVGPEQLPDDLLECLALRRQLDERVAHTLVQLQLLADGTSQAAVAARDHLGVLYRALNRHAGERLHWQSVFPVSPRKDHVPCV